MPFKGNAEKGGKIRLDYKKLIYYPKLLKFLIEKEG
jgi:hypothetical protein